jgi:hypothetical protein
MRCRLTAFFLFVTFFANGQSCTLLTQTFAVADTIKGKSGELYRFRFSVGQLDALLQLPGLEKPIAAIKKLQTTLDEDNASLRSGTLWQLDEKLATKQFEELKKECPETVFVVYRKEIDYYRAKYKPK